MSSHLFVSLQEVPIAREGVKEEKKNRRAFFYYFFSHFNFLPFKIMINKQKRELSGQQLKVRVKRLSSCLSISELSFQEAKYIFGWVSDNHFISWKSCNIILITLINSSKLFETVFSNVCLLPILSKYQNKMKLKKSAYNLCWSKQMMQDFKKNEGLLEKLIVN